jgi:integrase
MLSWLANATREETSRPTQSGNLNEFKKHRLATVNPRTGKPISPKTVKDSDLSGLKSVFRWAVSNGRMAENAAKDVTIKLGKTAKLRSKGFTDAEAQAILEAASSHPRGSEQSQTWAANRGVPWLCAYTGARGGELAQPERKICGKMANIRPRWAFVASSRQRRQRHTQGGCLRSICHDPHHARAACPKPFNANP